MAAKLLKRYAPSMVGAAVLTGVLYSLGFRESLQSLGKASLAYLALTPLLFLAASYLRIYKWVLMRDRMGAEISFAEINGVYFSSKFWGLVSPMRSGEVVPALARTGRGAQQGRLLSVILYDRVIETFQTLIVFISLFFAFYGVFFGARTGVALSGIFVALALFMFVLVTKEAGETVFSWCDSALSLFGGRRLAMKLRGSIHRFKGEMDEFYAATKSYFTVGFSLYTLFITFACWGLDMLYWLVMFKAFGIIASPLVIVASVMVYSMMATLTPIPSGLGVADMSFALVLNHFGGTWEVGGIIIVSRILGIAFPFLAYAAFNQRFGRRP